MKLIIRYVLTVLVSVLFSITAMAAQTIEVWSTYSSPPFAISKDNSNLTSALFDELTKNSQGKWIFELKSVPRKRVNSKLARGEQGIVVWSNPLWFGDKEEKKYHWTNRVIDGTNEIVSLKTNPVDYSGPESLFGKRFGGVLGHKYVGIDDYVKSNDIKRADTSSFSQNLTKLLNGRLDVILIPRSELYYIINKQQVGDKLYISPEPHLVYSRKFLVTKDLVDVRDYINEQLAILQNEQVDTFLTTYGLKR